MVEGEDKREDSNLSEMQKQIVAQMQGDIPLSKEPYRDIAENLGITESQLIKELQDLQNRGILRRVGAILKHRNAGYKANAMVAWKIPEEKVEQIGEYLSQFTAATHVYQRPTYPDWPFNLFTMIHAATEEECYDIALEMSKKTGITEYQLLFSTKEYQKTSMRYF